MLSLECFECKKGIAENTSVCPHCGYPLNIYSEFQKTSESQVGFQTSGAWTSYNISAALKLSVGIFCVFCVLGLLFFVYPVMRKQQDENWRKSQNSLGWITGDIEPLRLTCDELMDEVMTRSFESSLRDTIRLLSYQDIHLVSQDEDRLDCMAQALFTTGSEGRFIFFIEINEDKQNIGFHRP